jgi:hypothetical protein
LGADVAHSPGEDRDGLSHHHGLSVEVNAVFPQRVTLRGLASTEKAHEAATTITGDSINVAIKTLARQRC